ncbi:tyrosine-protein kinase [Caerostris extrusa]|uniref:Tyrosine-protein kinase n=1 Tax=Caerostris extrusa TaxID=172846 RepID=A0AAV4SQA2_CAEEX|nr:tyrosine-protein kinase [Caerostris extrusa]
MAGVIAIQFYLEKEPLKFSGNTYVAEDLIVESCKHLKIGPVGRHLFGLWSPSDSLWFPPNKVLKTVNGCVLNLYLRVRFLTPVVSCLRVSLLVFIFLKLDVFYMP